MILVSTVPITTIPGVATLWLALRSILRGLLISALEAAQLLLAMSMTAPVSLFAVTTLEEIAELCLVDARRDPQLLLTMGKFTRVVVALPP